MTTGIRIHPLARQDLIDQAAYLAEQASQQVAERFLESAERTFQNLAQLPRQGRLWQGSMEETEGLRVWQVEGFSTLLIFYRVEASAITVVRILHGARDLPELLGDLV